LLFDVGEGPRVYIERIDITGNTRTKDKVIRREFRLAEGDAFNAELIRKTRQRLMDLGYFQGVEITTAPGSAPDKAIVTTTHLRKGHGAAELWRRLLADAGAFGLGRSCHERNLGRHRIDRQHQRRAAQRRTSIDLSVTDP